MIRVTLPSLVALTLAASASAFTYEGFTEFHSTGDFDGDGRNDVIIVDRATGAYRIGYQLTSDAFTWSGPRASGVPGLTGFALGRVASTSRDSLLFTSPDANRVNLLDASQPSSAGLPTPIYPPAIGPYLVGALDLGGAGNTPHDDLVVYSRLNPGHRVALLRNDGAARSTLGDAAVAGVMRDQMSRIVLKEGGTLHLAYFQRLVAPGVDQWTAVNGTNGTLVTSLSLNLATGPRPWRYVSGRFNMAAGGLHQILLHQVGQTNFQTWPITETTPGAFAFGAGAAFSLTDEILQLIALPMAGETRLLVLSGRVARLYRFDGVTPPTLLRTFEAGADDEFTGATDYGNGRFALSAGRDGISRILQNWTASGTNYTLAGTHSLPAMNAVAGGGNVLLFRNEPFVSASPNLLRTLNAGDWSSQLGFSGGTPPAVSVRAESFLGATQGLRNPVTLPLSTAPSTPGFGLVNQHTEFISIFSLNPAIGDQVSDVRITPPPGDYSTTIQITLTPGDATHKVWYRFADNSSWLPYSAPLTLYTSAILQCYAEISAPPARSPMKRAAYTLPNTSTLDSDGDGVPDYVEIARGLDPNGEADSDGDGYPDFQELVAGTNPSDSSSAPTNAPRADLKTAFDLISRPQPYDGPANILTSASNTTPVRVYTASGSLLGFGLVSNNPPAGLTNAARITNIITDAKERFVVHATDLHFDVATASGDTRIGRELVAVIATPTPSPVAATYTYTGGPLATEADNWVASASNAVRNTSHPSVPANLSPADTLIAAVLERKVSEILSQRGVSGSSNVSLFPFRANDTGRSSLTSAALLALEQRTTNDWPTYRLRTMHAFLDGWLKTNPAASSLRTIATEIYDICSTFNNGSPADFVPPLDEIRFFLRHSTYDSNYLARSALSGSFSAAALALQQTLDLVPTRPVTNAALEAISPAPGQPASTFRRIESSAPVALLKSDGSPFDLPDGFNLVHGSRVNVFGYSDVTHSNGGGAAIEVIAATLLSVPIASDHDSDGDLLRDEWEGLFFGGPQDPFADYDGDGYNNFQEGCEMSDPRDPLGIPAVAPVPLARPDLLMVPDGSNLRLRFIWPGAYIGKVTFGVRATSSLSLPFAPVAGTTGPFAAGPNQWDMVIPAPPDPDQFFLLTIRLP